MIYSQVMKKYVCVVIMLCGVLFLSSSVVQAQPATLTTDLATWQSLIFGEELFQTTAPNIGLADGVSVPSDNTDVGSLLNFQTGNLQTALTTNVTQGFSVQTGQAGATFIFNERGSGPFPDGYENALSVGSFTSSPPFEDDDWSLRFLDEGASTTAFGLDIGSTRFAASESITLYTGSDNPADPWTILTSISLDPADPANAGLGLSSTVDNNVFLGIVSVTPFTRIDFDEDPDSDDIAIADFRFATVVPEPVSSTLFVIGGVAFGLRSWRKKKMNA